MTTTRFGSCRQQLGLVHCLALALALPGAIALLLLTPIAAVAQEGITKAPDWPNLLSEAGRRAAMALPASSPWRLEPTLVDLEDAARESGPAPTGKARYEARLQAAGTPPNVRANDPTGDQGAPTAETQSECAVAAFQSNVVVAWNDSKGLRLGSPTTISGFAWSTDGGQTFTDGGSVPLIGAGDQSYGDCTLDVDSQGNFYMGTIYVASGIQSVAVYRGTFSGGGFSWSTPIIAASGATGSLDKPYVCVDPVTGNIYVSYTRFGGTTAIEVVRGTSLGTVWTAPVVLESGSGIQGSRPIVGPEGNLYVCWQAGWGTINCGLASTTGSIRMRRSTNPAGALTFDPAITVGTVQWNWTSYWAGNLRNTALAFPDMAVDRSGGANNGTVYVTWNEAAPWTAAAASGVSTAETEANNAPLDAGVKTIVPGDDATGTISTSGDFDYWRLSVTAGQHVMLRLEPQGFNCGVSSTIRNFSIRLYKGVAGSAGDSLLANSNLNSFASEIVFDAPETATYYFRIRNVNASGTLTGTYTVKSRLLNYGTPSPARDMRDVVVARSTNLGVSFQPEVVVNNDAANLDNCIPAITCDNQGCVHVFFYDARDALGARILRSYYHAASSDGVSWQPNQRISNELMYYNLNTVAVPNYGEYNQASMAMGLPGENRVHATWSDERISQAATGSGVDTYVAKLQTCVTTSCPPDQTAESGQAVPLSLCFTNCGSFADDFTYDVTDTQGWLTPITNSVYVTPGALSCVNTAVVVPAGAVDGQQTVVTLRATGASCPGATQTCTMTITVQNPGLPAAGVDCAQSAATMVVEIFGQPATPLPVTGPSQVVRQSAVPAGPGFTIETELVSLALTGVDPFLGAVTVRESALYPSYGRITTGPAPFFPADSFFDVYFEIDTAIGTLFTKNKYRIAATINGIPPVGDTYSGNDMLLYQKTGNQAVPVGRILGFTYNVVTPFACFPPPGADCMTAELQMNVTLTAVGTDLITGVGPATLVRGAAFDPGDGRPQFPTEIVMLDLAGVSPLFGPFHIVESAPAPSTGQTKSQASGALFPADSFFDVFFELELPNLGVTAVGAVPARVAAAINAVPPTGTPHFLAVPITLIDKITSLPIGTLQFARFTEQVVSACSPAAGIDCHEVSGSMEIDLTGIGLDTVNLLGQSTMVRGPVEDAGSGLLQIETEMLALELNGNGAVVGAMHFMEDLSQASSGHMLSQSAGIMFPADSFFDVFFELTTPIGVLRPAVAMQILSSGVTGAPEPPGTTYTAVNLPLDLVDNYGVVRGRIQRWTSTVGNPCQLPTDVPFATGDVGFYGLRAAFPNPFTSQTSFAFRLDQERHVDLRVYNVRGQIVRHVVSARLGAGPQVLAWDGVDASGRTVGAGIYVYQLDIDGRGITRKVVKLR